MHAFGASVFGFYENTTVFLSQQGYKVVHIFIVFSCIALSTYWHCSIGFTHFKGVLWLAG